MMMIRLVYGFSSIRNLFCLTQASNLLVCIFWLPIYYMNTLDLSFFVFHPSLLSFPFLSPVHTLRE